MKEKVEAILWVLLRKNKLFLIIFGLSKYN